MIVWGGTCSSYCFYDTGARYDTVTDTWTTLSTTGPPLGRADHTAVWTGSDMIVFGGRVALNDYVNSGGIYILNP
jgi:N-acetylneuraminic acid mutarotase